MSGKFDEAVSALMLSQPFFSTLLMKMDHVETRSIPTLCVTHKRLMYNPDFLDKMTMDEAVFCVAHEVMHLAWEHLPRVQYYFESGMGPDGKKLNTKKFNQALDFPINHSLQVNKVGAVPDPSKIQICLNPQQYPHTMMPEDIYCKMPDDESDKGPDAMDEHDGQSDAGAPGAITPADILQAAENHKAIRGEYPAGMERLLERLKRPDVSPWAVLRSFITTNLPGHDRSSWRRPQRRYLVRGIGMPGPVSAGAGVIGVVVDTSGSIGDEMLQLFAGHMAAIIDDARPHSLRVYWTDAQVHRVDTVKNGSDLRALLQKSVPGGGGTNMPEGVAAAVEDKCDAVVVLTDGWTPFCGADRPLLWAITDHSKTAPAGITIHI